MDLDKFLKRFWEMEEAPTSIRVSEEDTWCEEFYRKTFKREVNGRYEVRLPFKNEKTGPTLGKSKGIALKRLENVESRLNKNKNLKEQYTKCIKEYSDLGHMRCGNWSTLLFSTPCSYKRSKPEHQIAGCVRCIVQNVEWTFAK